MEVLDNSRSYARGVDGGTDFTNLTYKDLQTEAKLCFHLFKFTVPANMRRDALANALTALHTGDRSRAECMVNQHKATRKRKLGLRLQNIMSTSKTRKKMNTKSKSKEESVVDSTSQELGDVTCFSNNVVRYSNPEHCPANYFRKQMCMNSSQQSQQCVGQLEQSASSNTMSGDDLISHALGFNNNHQFDFKNPAASSTPYDMLKYSSQNPAQQYYQSPSDVASKSLARYNCEQTYYPNPHCQSTSYSNTCDMSYNTGTDNYHQLPNYNRNSSMSLMQCSNTLANKSNFLNLSSSSQCNSFAKDTNNISELETDYSSPYLPNIPQLANVTAESTSTSHYLPSSWSQDTAHSSDSGRTRYAYEVQNQGVMMSSQNLNRKAMDATGANFMFDKYVDEETLSLNEDVANLLDTSKSDSHKSNSVSTYGANSGEAYYMHPNKEYINAAYDHFYSRSDCQNSVSVESVSGSNSMYPNQSIAYPQNDVSRSSLNFSNYSIDNIVAPQTPLPPIATFFRGTNHNYAANSHQAEPRQVSCTSLNNGACTDSTFASFTSERETSFMDSYSSNVNSNKSDDLNCIDLITPNSSPLGNDASSSILRNCLQVSHQLSDSEVVSFGQNESTFAGKAVPLKKKINLNFSKPRSNGSSSSSTTLSVPHSVLLHKSVQENKLNMNLRKVLVKANSDAMKEDKNNADVKTKVSQLIYESETFHRSKIVYNILNKNDSSSKEANVRKYLHLFEYGGADLPKRLQPVTVINSMTDEETQKKANNAFAVIPVYHRPCANKVRGCGTVLPAESLLKHEKRCLFKPICCPSDMCSWRNSMKLLTGHIHEDHTDEIEKRNQYLYILDRKKFDDRTQHTYYQVHKKTIYIIQLHIEENKCVANIQHIPDMDVVIRQEKPISVMMQMYAFCNKMRMKSWTGVTRPYYEEGQKVVDLMINVRNSEFIGLRVVID